MTESEAYDPKRDLQRMQTEIERLRGEHAAVLEAVNREVKEAPRAVDEAVQVVMAMPEDEVTEDHPKLWQSTAPRRRWSGWPRKAR